MKEQGWMQFNSRTRKEFEAGGLQAMTYQSNSALNPATPKGQQSSQILGALSWMSFLDPSGTASGVSEGINQYQRNANRSSTEQWMKTASGAIAAKQGFGGLITANNWIQDKAQGISSQYGRDALQYGPLPWLNPFYWIFGHVPGNDQSDEPVNEPLTDEQINLTRYA